MKDYVRLIISDLHLGSFYSKEESLCEMIESIEFDELILAGDIIDFIKIPTFTKRTIRFIETLKKKGKPIIYIIGNHDINLTEFEGETISGIKFVDKYQFDHADRTYRVMHGHQFDTGIVTWRFSMKIISVFQDMLERWFRWDLATWLVNKKLKKKTPQPGEVWKDLMGEHCLLVKSFEQEEGFLFLKALIFLKFYLLSLF